MNLVTCPQGHMYSAGNFDSCPECPTSAPVAPLPVAKVSTATKPKKARKQGKSTSKETKPLLAATAINRLYAAGLNTDAKIAAGLANGLTANALYGADSGDSEGVFLRYLLLVERVEGEYPEVAKYRNRLVSGIAA